METAIAFKIGVLSIASFLVAVFSTPLLTHFLYKHKLGKQIRDSASAPIFSALHKDKSGTPTMGGILIWGTVLAFALIIYLGAYFFPDSFWDKFNFLTREQTLLPLGAFVIASLIGLFDDYLNIKKIGPKGGGLSMKHKLLLFTLIAIGGALWFYFKLDWDVFHIPFLGNFTVGWWYIPIFIFVIVATSFSVNEIDGLDGLAGGTLATSFAALGVMAFAQGKYDLATFIGVIVGALLAFLWYNINPARFFMGDTGSMGLGVALGVIAMLTNTALLLCVVGVLFVIESLSVIVQLLSKKFHGKKIFHSTPIHHHFQALGWPEHTIVMRFWVISAISSAIGVVLFLLDNGWY